MLIHFYIAIILHCYITIFPDAVARVLLPYISAQGSEASLPRDLALSLWAGIGAFVQSARGRPGSSRLIPAHSGSSRTVGRRAVGGTDSEWSLIWGIIAGQHLPVRVVNGA